MSRFTHNSIALFAAWLFCFSAGEMAQRDGHNSIKDFLRYSGDVIVGVYIARKWHQDVIEGTVKS